MRVIKFLKVAIGATLFSLAVGVSASADELADLLDKGDGFVQEGKIASALEAYQRAVDQNPDSALALRKMAGMLMVKNEYPNAIDAYKRSIGLDASDSIAWIGLGTAFLHMGDYALASASFTEAKRLNPDKGKDIDAVLTWIAEKRNTSAPEAAHQLLDEKKQD